METTYSIKDVTRDLGFLLSLTKIYEADDKGFWYDPALAKRVSHKLDATEGDREIVLFQDPMPKGDFYYFNPFSEGFGKKSPATQLYYSSIRISLNLNLRMAMMYVVRSLVDVKAAEKADNEYSLSHILTRMSSVPIDRKSTIHDAVDEKMIEEFETLFTNCNDELVFVPYLKQQMTAKVKVDVLTDPQWDEKFSKGVRKKTLTAFKAVLMGVLGITKPEELNVFSVKYDPDLKTSAQFYTVMSVYLKLYTRFNDILADAWAVDGKPSNRDTIDLGELTAVIERFTLAHAIAKHMVQTILPKNHPVDPAPVDTSRLTIGGNTGTRRFAGPEVIDDLGRRSRPLATPSINRPVLGTGRFQPHVLQDAPLDPFAPMTRNTNVIGLGNNGGGGGFSGGGLGGGYFGSNGGLSLGGGLNTQAPSNFGSPGVQRSYFQ